MHEREDALGHELGEVGGSKDKGVVGRGEGMILRDRWVASASHGPQTTPHGSDSQPKRQQDRPVLPH